MPDQTGLTVTNLKEKFQPVYPSHFNYMIVHDIIFSFPIKQESLGHNNMH